MFKAKVTAQDVGKRADVFVSEHLPKYSRSSLSVIFDSGKVKIKDLDVKPGYKLKIDNELSVDTGLLKTHPMKINLPIIYENESVIVINKPAGLLTHSKGALNDEPTIASFIAPKITDSALSGNRAGIVHRLDRPTSGVIITAKTEKAVKWLQKQFSTRKVIKTYTAIVEGIPEPKKALIDAPIGRNPRKPQTFKVGSFGKSATTQYKTLKSFKLSGKDVSLVEFQPKTGRTHQIRIHAQHIGHPLIGDPVYGHAAGNMYLHAKKLELILPSGQLRSFEVNLPTEFENLVKSK